MLAPSTSTLVVIASVLLEVKSVLLDGEGATRVSSHVLLLRVSEMVSYLRGWVFRIRVVKARSTESLR
jgi:hypothetical protein